MIGEKYSNISRPIWVQQRLPRRHVRGLIAVLVAKKVLEAAQGGERDPQQLLSCVPAQLGLSATA